MTIIVVSQNTPPKLANITLLTKPGMDVAAMLADVPFFASDTGGIFYPARRHMLRAIVSGA